MRAASSFIRRLSISYVVLSTSVARVLKDYSSNYVPGTYWWAQLSKLVRYVAKTDTGSVGGACRCRTTVRPINSRVYLVCVLVVGDVATVDATSLIRGALLHLFSTFGVSTSIIYHITSINWRIVNLAADTESTVKVHLYTGYCPIYTTAMSQKILILTRK